MDYNLAIFCGRFQPIHLSHLEAIRQGLSIAEQVLVIIGSSHSAPDIKNPFTFPERVALIKTCLNPEENQRVRFAPVRDYFYNEFNWITEIQNSVAEKVNKDDSIALLGHYKDSSSYYLSHFPQWEFVPIKATRPLNSTDIRKNFFDPIDLEEINSFKDKTVGTSFIGSFDSNLELSMNTKAIDWLKANFFMTERHMSLIKEYQFIKKYKEIWAAAPFPPTFVTTDTVVVKSGHVLLIRRKFEPGKGLYALPGGFIKQTEKIEDGAIRELKEETRIDLPKIILSANIKEVKIFDHPERSKRGRTITHAHYIDLGKGELPEVKASDDASGAFWIPLMNLGKLEDQFFEDHLHMINYFISR